MKDDDDDESEELLVLGGLKFSCQQNGFGGENRTPKELKSFQLWHLL